MEFLNYKEITYENINNKWRDIYLEIDKNYKKGNCFLSIGINIPSRLSGVSDYETKIKLFRIVRIDSGKITGYKLERVGFSNNYYDNEDKFNGGEIYYYSGNNFNEAEIHYKDMFYYIDKEQVQFIVFPDINEVIANDLSRNTQNIIVEQILEKEFEKVYDNIAKMKNDIDTLKKENEELKKLQEANQKLTKKVERIQKRLGLIINTK